MPKDFASRPKHTPARKTTRYTQRPATPTPRVFHGPSFSAGVLLGAMIIIGAAYVPDLLATRTPVTQAVEPAVQEKVTFEFHEILEKAEVPTDPAIYVDPAKATRAGGDYLLQAASFRRAEDAEKLRANLILMDLPAATAKVQLDSGAWYRVLVGPFQTRTDAERAVVKLREQNVPVMWIRKKSG